MENNPLAKAKKDCLQIISLHGLEDIGHQVRCKSIRGGRGIDAINGFRYADDVVFILKPQDDATALREVIDRFLEIRRKPYQLEAVQP